jgi:ABC-type polysaccharide/polyol phosphate export permease
LWQWRDYLIDRGLPIFLVGSLLGYVTLAPQMPALHRNLASLSPRLIAKFGGVDAATASVMKDFNEAFLRNFLGAVVFMGALLAMNGIVANDRKLGYYRFLFSKPVAPWRYYGQAFVIHWVGFVAVMALLGALYGVLVWPVLSVQLLIVVALMFLTYGGITFALSAAARWDWLSLVSVAVAAMYFWERYKESDSVIAKLLYLLPPLHRTSDVYNAVAKGEPLPWHLLEWFAGYGVACYLLGLLVLRVRRLAIV